MCVFVCLFNNKNELQGVECFTKDEEDMQNIKVLVVNLSVRWAKFRLFVNFKIRILKED